MLKSFLNEKSSYLTPQSSSITGTVSVTGGEGNGDSSISTDPNFIKFHDFQRKGRSPLLLFLFNCLLTFVYFPYYLYYHYIGSFHCDYFYFISYQIQLILYLFSLFCAWIVFLLLIKQKYYSVKVTILSIMFNTMTIFFCFQFITKVMWNSFAEERKTEIEENNNIPADILTLLAAIPFVASELYRETNQISLFIHWFTRLITFIVATILSPNLTMGTILVTYLIVSSCALLDRFLFRLKAFEANAELESIIELNTRNALQRKVTEMRDLIGNIAHDLKTPLTSFMTATEIMQHDIERSKEKVIQLYQNFDQLPSVLPDSVERSIIQQRGEQYQEKEQQFQQLFQECSNNMLASIHSMKDIHSFMLMMINRCLDFTKVSNGIDLIPEIEWIDLFSVIQLPMNCMKNIQDRIRIEFIPPSSSEALPIPYIQTDKQWLQENLLCLLSNAVKYSHHEGSPSIQLTISLKTALSLQKTPCKVVDEVLAKDHIIMTRRRESLNSRRIRSREDRKMNSSRRSPNNSSERIPLHPRLRNPKIHLVEEQSNPVDGPNSPKSVQANIYQLITPYSTVSATPLPVNKNKETNPSEQQSPPPVENEITSFILFEVQDNGSPLLSDQLLTFFNPLKQKRFAGGTGLGLYTLAKRVEALGGEYGVHPREDGSSGLVVWFTIPYSPDTNYEVPMTISSIALNEPQHSIQEEEEILKEESTTPPTIIRQFSTHSSSKLLSSPLSPVLTTVKEKKDSTCVLVVEDSPTIAKMTSIMLTKQNISTEIAENGSIAVTKVLQSYQDYSNQGTKYDAILMDFQMPIMDGIEATVAIRDYEQQMNILASHQQCIIGISAISDAEIIQEAMDKGMNDFLSKPFSIKDFADYIQHVKLQEPSSE